MSTKDKKGAGLGTLKLKEELAQKEEQFHKKDNIFGPMLLTNGGYISSSRGVMFTSHINQFVNLDKPDFPRVFTNYENLVGKHSTRYKKAKHNYVVVDRISKFGDGEHVGHVYLLFMYDEENDRYDVMEKRNVEDLTEKFGFVYDNTVLDTKEVGSHIHKDEILVKTPSYDKDMNYCYGKNVTFSYMSEPHNIEDAIMISRSLANSMTSKEIETVKVSLNDNDILCNLYGNNEYYKSFPDICEPINGKVLCAKRRIHMDRVLYDMKSSNLRRINFSTDVMSYNEGRIVDITIYCNKTLDEIPDNIFNRQLRSYLINQKRYHEQIRDRCKQIMDSGSDYSRDINFYYKKAIQYLDDNYKWRDDNHSVFSNMHIEFVVERTIPLSEGQKLTGRYGNKGVISKIIEDEDMPYLENGKRVDILFNPLGVINRLNSQQLNEQSITFVCDRTTERMVTFDNRQDKEDLMLDIIGRFNKKQAIAIRNYMDKLSESQRDMFIQNTIDEGIYIHNPPLWEDETMFAILRNIYKDHPWIKPYKVYVKRFGRVIPIMKDLVVGSMYVMKLKQTSKKGFSVRSTGSLSRKGLPEKNDKAKTHQDLFSKTPIRFGKQLPISV